VIDRTAAAVRIVTKSGKKLEQEKRPPAYLCHKPSECHPGPFCENAVEDIYIAVAM
jgi:hypothetical protein